MIYSGLCFYLLCCLAIWCLEDTFNLLLTSVKSETVQYLKIRFLSKPSPSQDLATTFTPVRATFV